MGTASFISLKESEDRAISELDRQVKAFVKEYRKSQKDNGAISNKSYSLIHGSIKFWSISSSEKIKELYCLHEEAMQAFPLTQEEIIHFIKFRDGITHGADQLLNSEIVSTTMKLRALIYCCLLNRIGVPEERIVSLCRTKINR